MDIRKIQATGGSSLSVTLPKVWTNRYKLKDKDTVFITEQLSGDLLLVSEKKKKLNKKNVVMSIDKNNLNTAQRFLVSYYKLGIDNITIKFSDFVPEDKRKKRKNRISSLLGWEIIDETRNSLEIQYLLDISRISAKQTLKQLFINTQEMLYDLGNTLGQKDAATFENIIDRDNDIDKFCLLIERLYYSVISGHLTEEEIKTSTYSLGYYRGVALHLERIADHAEKMARVLLLDERNDNTTKELSNVIAKLDSLLNEVSEIVFHKDILETNSVARKIAYLKEETHFSSDFSKYLFKNVIIKDSASRIRNYISNILEEVIDSIVLKRFIDS